MSYKSNTLERQAVN